MLLNLVQRYRSETQQIRSLSLHEIMKDDVWDTRNYFRNMLNTMVMEENFRHETMEELERALLVKIKDWIERERPKANACEAPWKTYIREHYESLYASGMS